MLSTVKRQSTLIYLNDIVVLSKPVHQHVAHLQRFLALLQISWVTIIIENAPSLQIKLTTKVTSYKQEG